MRYTIFLVFTLSGFFTQAQFTDRGRQYVDTLCSSYFWGRGYTNEGAARASYFLSNQLDYLGVKPLGSKYFQEFPVTVNTFPFEVDLQLNGEVLKPGKDYQPRTTSGSGKGVFKAFYADSITGAMPYSKERVVLMLSKTWLEFVEKDRRTEVIDSLANFYPIILEAGEKLTWSVGHYQTPHPVIEVKSNRFYGVDKARIKVKAVLERNYYCNNVCAVVKGTQYPDSFLVLTAHYDHLGGMGEKTFIPGANDNASGTAMLLTLAEYYQKHPQKYSVAFLFFAGEEAGLVGSAHFVSKPLIPLKRIKFLMNVDLMGTGAEGATVVNATVFPDDFKRLLKTNEAGNFLVKINERGEAANSDHYWFTKAGVPSFFMYLQDKNYTAYHQVEDRAADLPLTRFSATCQLIIDFLNSY